MVRDKEVASCFHGSDLDVFKDLSHLFRIEIVGSETSVNGRLDGVRGSTHSIPELVLDPGHTSVYD